MIMGITKETTAVNLKTPTTETTERVYPRNIAPVSPIKIFAGFELNGRNPIQEPTRIAVIIIIEASACRIETTRREVAQIAETPQASPSSPSIKLIAFVSPTIHIRVIGIENQPN